MGVALRPQQSRGSRHGGAAMVDAREQAGARGSGGLPKGRKKMTSGSEGKMAFYTFAQLKIIIILDVVCWRQNRNFTMCWRQNQFSRCTSHKTAF